MPYDLIQLKKRNPNQLHQRLVDRGWLACIVEPGHIKQLNLINGELNTTVHGTVEQLEHAILGPYIRTTGTREILEWENSPAIGATDITFGIAFYITTVSGVANILMGTSSASTNGARITLGSTTGQLFFTKDPGASIGSGINIAIDTPYFVAVSFRNSDGALRFVVKNLITQVVQSGTGTDTDTMNAGNGELSVGGVFGFNAHNLLGGFSFAYMGNLFLDTSDLINWAHNYKVPFVNRITDPFVGIVFGPSGDIALEMPVFDTESEAFAPTLAPVIFLIDTFTDPNDTFVQDHDPEVGGSWELTDQNFANLVIQNNRVFNHSPPPPGFRSLYYNLADPLNADYTIEAEIRVVSLQGWAKIAGRVQASGLAYHVAIRADVSPARIDLDWGITGSNFFELAEEIIPDLVVGGDYILKLTMFGSSIKVYLDDELIVDVTDANVTATGHVGIGGFNSSATTGLHISSISAFTGVEGEEDVILDVPGSFDSDAVIFAPTISAILEIPVFDTTAQSEDPIILGNSVLLNIPEAFDSEAENLAPIIEPGIELSIPNSFDSIAEEFAPDSVAGNVGLDFATFDTSADSPEPEISISTALFFPLGIDVSAEFPAPTVVANEPASLRAVFKTSIELGASLSVLGPVLRLPVFGPINSAITVGLLRIQAEDAVDRFTHWMNVAIEAGLGPPGQNFVDWMSENQFPGIILVDRLTTNQPDEDWGHSTFFDVNYDAILTGTLNGADQFEDQQKILELQKATKSMKYYVTDVAGVYHQLTLSAEKSGQSFHLKLLELAGILGGRL